MEITAVQYLMSVLGLSIYVYLLWTGYRRNLFKHYPFFFGFIAWCLVRDVTRWIVSFQWGLQSDFVSDFYNITGIPTPLGQIFLLLEIYNRVKFRRDVQHWLVLVLFSGLMTLYSLNGQQSNFYLVFHNIALYFQVLFCLLVHLQFHQNRRIYLGRNYSGILYGLSLMIALQSFNYSLKLFEIMPNEYFVYLVQLLSFIPWVAYIVTMRQLDVPGVIEPEVVEELASIEANFRRAARCLR